MATQCRLPGEAIGQALRKRYAVTTELPPKLLALVGKLAAVENERQLRTPVRRRSRGQLRVALRVTSWTQKRAPE